MERKRWYAVYTRPRWEKKANLLLMEKGIETYCPLNKVRRKWSDRMKVVEEPLFKSYVFVRILDGDKTPVRMTNGIVNFVYWLGRPAILRDKEIDTIKRFLNEYEQVEAVPAEVTPNSKVFIKSGVLMDEEATVLRVVNRKVEVFIESIGYSLVAYVDRSNISVVPSRAKAKLNHKPIKKS